MLPHAPLPFSWGQYVDLLVAERGSLTELARHLLDVAPASAELSDDPMTLERGLRRLRQRGAAPGEKYGRLLIRCLGIPASVADEARELGQYRSRLSDLPLPTRRAQLRLWDTAPISESACAAWIHLAQGSLAMRDLDLPQVERRLALARLGSRAAGPEAQLELALFEARVLSDRGDGAGADAALEGAAAVLVGLPPGDGAAAYFARLQDQRAFRAARGWRTEPERLATALAAYAAIPEAGASPFAAFRRAHGVAWCRWRQGDLPAAHTAAEAASRHAGDGGFVRFRALALGLQARIVDAMGGDGGVVRRRAREMAERLQDPALAAELAA